MPACRARRLVISSITAFGVALTMALPMHARTIDEDDEIRSLVGSYLAGRFAKNAYDSNRAADFYRLALVRDPANEVLVEQAFLMEATEANWSRTMALARELVEKQPTHRMAQLFLGVNAFKEKNYAKADEHFQAASNGPIGELTSALLRAWVKLAAGKPAVALSLLESPKQAEWAQFYLRYHRALIGDIAGRQPVASEAFQRVQRQESRTLRTTLAYARHAAFWGDREKAKAILKENLDKADGEGHPLARALMEQIDKRGNKVGLLLSNPAEGMSEVLYGLGEALTGEGGVGIGVLYLQMALYLQPDQPFALAALANAHEATKNYTAAIATYDRIPKGSPLQSAVEIRKALNLNSLEKVDEAKALLETVAIQNPKDLKPLDALGNIMRAHKRFNEAADYYSRAISLIVKPEKAHWTYFYSRGTAYERMKNWTLAEADLKKALQLSPDQPLALNYLGYSWIDQGQNLKQGLALIEKAVALKPDDGYVVDSLGWAHFKLGNFKDAVRFLERAVELRPEDPVLNDHLGDALWRVGREREARFQWQQALSLGPEPEDVEKIKTKLEKGLPSRTQARVLKKAKAASNAAQLKKPSDNELAPSGPAVQ